MGQSKQQSQQQTPIRLVLSHSSLSKFHQCNRKFYWEYVWPDRTDLITQFWDGSGAMAAFGQTVHKIMEHLYTGHFVGIPDEESIEVIRAAKFEGVKGYKKDEPLVTVEQIGMAVQELYNTYFHDDTVAYTCLPEITKVAPLGLYTDYKSILDLALHKPEPAQEIPTVAPTKIVDYKTSTYTPEDKQFMDHHGQMLGQLFASGAEVCVIRHIHISKGKIDVTEHPIQRDDYLIELWANEARTVANTIRRYAKDGFWPMNSPSACGAFGRKCPFFHMCEGGSRPWPGMTEVGRKPVKEQNNAGTTNT